MWIPKAPTIPSGVIAIILAICCIYPYIVIFDYINYCTHKNQVVIEQTVCEGLSWSDEGYSGGTDYLDFCIDVCFKKKEVSVLHVHTLVFKGDKFIGHVDLKFDGTNERIEDATRQYYFESNSSQKLYFHLKHNSNDDWENNEIFKELYYGNLQDYTFKTNVISVSFTDSVVVGHNFASYYYDEKGTIYFKDENSRKEKYYYYDDKGKRHYA